MSSTVMKPPNQKIAKFHCFLSAAMQLHHEGLKDYVFYFLVKKAESCILVSENNMQINCGIFVMKINHNFALRLEKENFGFFQICRFHNGTMALLKDYISSPPKKTHRA